MLSMHAQSHIVQRMYKTYVLYVKHTVRTYNIMLKTHAVCVTYVGKYNMTTHRYSIIAVGNSM